MVMIWRSLFWFICSIIAARVVDFPLPVGPVTRISPRGSIAILYKMVGIFRSSSVGIVEFKSRIVAAIFFCWRNTLTRWRHPSDVRIAKSASFPFAKCFFCFSFIMDCRSSAVSSALYCVCACTSLPCTRYLVCIPSEMWMSDAPQALASRMIASIF